MPPITSPTYSCFAGYRLVRTGAPTEVALAYKHLQSQGSPHPALVFDDTTGRTIDIDTRGSDEDMLNRLARSLLPSAPTTDPSEDSSPPAEPRGRGRPRLGVVAKEVTLLPRHWEWLAAQPGGASVMLRKLVEEARLHGSEKEDRRQSNERAYHFMQAIAGDLPGFEEATRALFALDAERFRQQIANWPEDVRHHAVLLAFGIDADDRAASS